MRHIELLSRTGHVGRGAALNPELAGLLLGGRGWAAAVTISRCDAACAEEVAAALAPRRDGESMLSSIQFVLNKNIGWRPSPPVAAMRLVLEKSGGASARA